MTAGVATAPEMFSPNDTLFDYGTGRTDLGFWSRFKPRNINKKLENATAPQEGQAEVKQKIEELFSKFQDEIFEDGMESDFSRELIKLVVKFNEQMIDALTILILQEGVNEEIASDTLRWIGRIEHSASYNKRLWLLERSLFSPSARIRDAAVVSLASLDDPHAIRFIRTAIERETYPELREDLQQVVVQLEGTVQCPWS